MLSMSSVLQRTLRLHGASVAIRDAGGHLDWSQYIARIARAAGMRRALGVGPGDRYAILSRNSVRQAELIYAGYWSGAVPVPVNFRLAPAEIADLLEDAGCKAVAVEDKFVHMLERAPLDAWRSRAFGLTADALAPASGVLPHYDALRDAAAALDAHDPDEGDDAILLYTGGTTGRGKGVRITHRNIVANALQLAHIMAVREEDSYLHVSPMFHSTDLKATALTLHGGCHVYLPDFTPAGVLEAIERYRITIGSLVPTMIIRILQDAAFGRHDISSLRIISYGTSPMAAEWIRKTMDAFPGVAMQQVYGLTETAPVLAILDEHAHAKALAGREELLRAGGRPVAGVDLRILGEDGREVPAGESGEIVIRGPQVCNGYHARPRETAEAFRNGWFHTGDIGRVDSEGYLFVLDRKKDMVITGGENVYTSEVEAAIYQHPGVHEVAVVGMPDERYGEALCAVIVPAAGVVLTPEAIIEHCRGRIGGYKIPRRVAFVAALPKSAMGKTLKQELRRAVRGESTETQLAGLHIQQGGSK
ncbi:MAG: AMP-binding protein [Betaproteobacteria bacterium]|nr:AMP-binding protein [Betaproteobacteria bacterium]